MDAVVKPHILFLHGSRIPQCWIYGIRFDKRECTTAMGFMGEFDLRYSRKRFVYRPVSFVCATTHGTFAADGRRIYDASEDKI